METNLDIDNSILDSQTDAAEVLKASQPYGLVSKSTAGIVTALSATTVTTSLVRLEKLGMIEEQETAKIEKKGRPEKIYRVTQNGVTWLQSNGFEAATVLAMSDPIDLAHRYCQALVGIQSNSKAEIEKIIPLSNGRNIRIDVAVPLSKGVIQFVEIEQKLDRSNILRAIEKFRALRELFNDENRRPLFSLDVLIVFNLKTVGLPRTLNVWKDALARAFPSDTPLPFTPRFSTLDTFVYDPGFENMERFPLLEKGKVSGTFHLGENISDNGLFDPRLAPSTKQLLLEMQSLEEPTSDLTPQLTDQLIGFCEIAMTIYRKSMNSNSPTRKYSAFPHESIQALKQFLHLSQNAGLLQSLKDGIAWIEARKSGLLLYRDGITKLVWDVVLRYFGFGRGGPLNVFVGIPDLGDKSSQIRIDVILEKSEEMQLPWTSAKETYEDAISWMLTALTMYPVDLGLASSLWPSSRRQKSEGS